MKVSELWLREWVSPKLSREELCEKLTMSGLEVEELLPVAEEFTGVVVGEIVNVEKHPDSDKLHLCKVNIANPNPLTIVCGAANVKVGMRVPTAVVGAKLSNNLTISRSKIRGIESDGMLCSAKELGLAEQSEGLLSLSRTAPIGKDVWEYLALKDYVINISITPNRGDCLSILGLAKEISAITHSMLHTPATHSVRASIQDKLNVELKIPEACPHYVGRVIRGVQVDKETPIWMQERLRRSGQRCINPVVDIMNYVMLELGQPMHAFDLDKISGNIQVRTAQKNESLALLDGQEVQLDEKTLVIADAKGPLAMAGVMGGLDSAVSLLTKDIFLESAYFHPSTIGRAGRKYLLNSESSYRFERGIDPLVQVTAIERATQLLIEITGGQPGPVIEVKDDKWLPQPKKLLLQAAKIKSLLGLSIADDTVQNILNSLGFKCEKEGESWNVIVPARRSDINLNVDLIEEIARLYGYDQIPTHLGQANLQIHARPENKLSIADYRKTLCDLGYHEVITYSFVSKKIQALLDPEVTPKVLVNPITAEMEVMRTNLWPGLVSTFLYNQNRQQDRQRLFEVGLRFIENKQLTQNKILSGLISGSVVPEQWGVPSRKVDFFDLKGDVEQLIGLTHAQADFNFKRGDHPALHPGQTAFIYRKDNLVGMMGALHPQVLQALDIAENIFVFELLMDEIETGKVLKAQEISKFPEIRRDIAILVEQTVPVQHIQDTITNVAGELLKNVVVFDIYQGKGIASDQKSVALALTLQHAARTLVDEEVAELIERVIVALKEKFAAELRG